MYLVLSKRFEISSSYRYFRPDWSEKKNREVYGPAVGGEHGFGGNFVIYFVFNGEVDPHTGMIINVAVVKDRVRRLLADRYDHKFLNRDTPPFDHIVPTPEWLARQLLEDVRPLFADESAEPVACHIDISPATAATAYLNGRTERHHWLEFSAARRTWSPHLTETENFRLFGKAASPSGHGHYYRLRTTLRGDIQPDSGMIAPDPDCVEALRAVHDLLDHRNLTTDVPELRNKPLTTEYLAQFLYEILADSLPVNRVRLWENPYLYAEYLGEERHVMGITADIRAAHRLHSQFLSDEENRATYGKCDNPNGHGHRYIVEAAIAGRLDKRSGTLFPLDRFMKGLGGALKPWDYKHLDLDTDDFSDMPSTGEDIIRVLWPRAEEAIDHNLHRLRLWETPNNRFTLRRDVE
jgi:6-pyruvoyltetrahydropterin/6-carboxytetrahydropterin synthase